MVSTISNLSAGLSGCVPATSGCAAACGGVVLNLINMLLPMLGKEGEGGLLDSLAS